MVKNMATQKRVTEKLAGLKQNLTTIKGNLIKFIDSTIKGTTKTCNASTTNFNRE